MLVALAGLPASGKSTLARRLKAALGATLLDKDALRAFLFEHRVDYSAAQNDLVVDIAYRVAAYLHGRSLDGRPGGSSGSHVEPIVLIDGRTYSEHRQVEALKAAAAGMGARLLIIECRCSEETARARLAADVGTHPAADRDFSLYLRRRAGAEPIVEPRLSLDTDALSPEDCTARAIAYLRERVGGVADPSLPEPSPPPVSP